MVCQVLSKTQTFCWASSWDLIKIFSLIHCGLAAKGRVKKMWIYPHLGGLVMMGTKSTKKNKKKHAFKIHFRPFLVIIDQLFFTFLGGSDQALSQAAFYANICYHNPIPLLPPTPITANQHHPPSTSDSHCYHPPLMPPNTSIRHCTTHHGWWQS